MGRLRQGAPGGVLCVQRAGKPSQGPFLPGPGGGLPLRRGNRPERRLQQVQLHQQRHPQRGEHHRGGQLGRRGQLRLPDRHEHGRLPAEYRHHRRQPGALPCHHGHRRGGGCHHLRKGPGPVRQPGVRPGHHRRRGGDHHREGQPGCPAGQNRAHQERHGLLSQKHPGRGQRGSGQRHHQPGGRRAHFQGQERVADLHRRLRGRGHDREGGVLAGRPGPGGEHGPGLPGRRCLRRRDVRRGHRHQRGAE